MNYLLNNKEFYNTCNYSLDKTNTLLIWGEKDGVIPISVGYQLNQQFPKTTKLMVFKKAKHDAHFRNAKQFNKIITLFLN
jgi:pimeloyl-ACP methyl ester carboxylesterase